MKALILQGPSLLELVEAPLPASPPPGYALVRVLQVGICGSDLHAYRGSQTFFTYPRIVGHELAVQVLALGESSAPPPVQVGDLCTVEPYFPCGQCLACRRGRPNCCEHLRVLGVHIDGGLQEIIAVPLKKLHPSTVLTMDELTLVEPLAIGAHAVRRAALEEGEWALVVGAGPIGQAVTTFAHLSGARLIIAELSERRLAFCREHLPVEACLDAKADLLGPLREITGGDLPTVVFDATGSTRSMMRAFEYVAHSGRLIFVGHNPQEITFSDPLFHAREMALLASRNATTEDFRQVMAALEKKAFDAGLWVREKTPLEEVPACFPTWLDAERSPIKPVVVMPS